MVNKFVTREELADLFNQYATESPIRKAFDRLFAERDAALKVAEKWLWLHRDISRARTKDNYSEEIYAEVTALLEGKK